MGFILYFDIFRSSVSSAQELKVLLEKDTVDREKAVGVAVKAAKKLKKKGGGKKKKKK